jgi:flagellar export protein FliJ
MRPFTFRLQTLLDQKLAAELAAKVLLADTQRALQQQQKHLLDLQGKEAHLAQRVAATRAELLLGSGAISSTALQHKSAFLDGLRQDHSVAHDNVLIQQFTVEEAELAVNQARAKLVECSREVEKLTKYRDRLFERHRSAAAKKEELEQDELGTVMFLAKKASQ